MSIPQTEVTLDQAMQIGAQHYQAGNFLAADRTFRDVLNAVPSHAPALHFLGVTCYARGNPQEGITHIEKAIEQDPDNPEYLDHFGVLLSASNRKEEALDAWERAIKAAPDYVSAYSNRANTLWELKRYREAEESARKATKIDPAFPDGWLNLGNALQGLDKPEKALEAWEKTLEINPHDFKPWNNLGSILRELGRLNESEEKCRKALEIDPQAPQAWNNLGNVLRDLGNLEEAVSCYRKAIKFMPNYPEAHNNLAVALIDQNRLQEALESARYAVAFRDSYAQAHGNLSVIYRELGEYDNAESSAQRAIALEPDDAANYLDLADVLLLRDRFGEAEAALTTAEELAPDSARVYIKLANVLERLNRVPEALEALDKAVKISPEFPDLYRRKGMIYYMAGMIPQAKECLDKALDMNPDNPFVYGSLAEILQSENDLEGSEKAIRKALELNPDIPNFYLSLGKLKKFTEGDEDLQKLLSFEDNADKMGKPMQAAYYFALYKAHSDLKQDEKAFEALKKGNDAKRETVPYDAKQNALYFEQAKATFNKEHVATVNKKPGHKDKAPIFILGMPRSGTTLTEQIISSHEDVFPAGELSAFSSIARKIAVTEDSAKDIGKQYIEDVYATFPEAKKHKHFTDKMPGNFMRVGEILMALPEAKIIHCRRNPVDTCLSCYKQLFARGQYWSYNLEELADQYNHYLDMMDFWRKTFPGQFLEVDYEDTVADLETQARRMLDYIGLPWDDACLEPHKQKRAVMTASKMQVIKPVYQSSVAAWKRYEEQLKPLTDHLETLESPVIKG